MTLAEFHSLKTWHQRHARQHPVERHTWDAVLTLWMTAWIGGIVALVLGNGWVELSCLALLFLPRAYVALRRRLHRSGRVRCDWMAALR